MTTATEGLMASRRRPARFGGEASTQPVLYRVTDAMRALSMSRTVIYDLIRAGRLRTVHEGRARRIPASAIAEYVALLEREAGGNQ